MLNTPAELLRSGDGGMGRSDGAPVLHHGPMGLIISRSSASTLDRKGASDQA